MSTTWTHEPAVFAALAAADASLAEALECGLFSLPPGDAALLVDAIGGIKSRTDALLARAVRQVEATGAHTTLGQKTVKQWLRRGPRMSGREAARTVTLTDLLGQYEQTAQALADGTISGEVAIIIGTAVRALPATASAEELARAEAALIGQADTLEPEQLVVLGKHLAELLTRQPDTDDPDEQKRLREQEEKDAASAYERRNLRLTRRPDGTRRITGLLPGEEAAVLWQMLDHLAKPLPDDDGVTDQRTQGQRLADALVELARCANDILTEAGTSTGDDADNDSASPDDTDPTGDTHNDDADVTGDGDGRCGDIDGDEVDGGHETDDGWGDTPVWPHQPTFDDLAWSATGADGPGQPEDDEASADDAGEGNTDAGDDGGARTDDGVADEGSDDRNQHQQHEDGPPDDDTSTPNERDGREKTAHSAKSRREQHRKRRFRERRRHDRPAPRRRYDRPATTAEEFHRKPPAEQREPEPGPTTEPGPRPGQTESGKSRTRSRGKPRPGRGGLVPYQVSVVLDYHKLIEQQPNAGILDDGSPLPATTLLRLLCTAELLPAVFDGPTLPLHLGRRRRLFSPAQQTAFAIRDRGCAFPGCDRPPRMCDAHHNLEWDKYHGPTDVTNGSLACTFHHQRIHREGWTVRIAANGYPEFIPPRAFDPDRRPRQHYRYRNETRTG